MNDLLLEIDGEHAAGEVGMRLDRHLVEIARNWQTVRVEKEIGEGQN